MSKSFCTIFSNSICSLPVSVSHLVIPAIFQTFSFCYIYYYLRPKPNLEPCLNSLQFCEGKRGEVTAEENSEAHRNSLMTFKERRCLQNIKMQGKAASAGVDAAASYPEDLAKITTLHDSCFSVGKVAFCWKKMPSRTFIAAVEKSVPGFKPSKNNLTLSLGANTPVA